MYIRAKMNQMKASLLAISAIIISNLLFGQCTFTWDSGFFQNESCYGMNDGQAQITNISGGTGPYTVEWISPTGLFSTQTVSSGSSASVTGLYGTDLDAWQVTITDAIGCTFSTNFYVQSSGATISFIKNNPQCYGTSNGSITMVATGAIFPGSVFDLTNDSGTVVNAPGTNTANNLPSGLYHIIFTDNNSCIDTQYVQLVDPDPVVAQVSIVSPLCSGGTISSGSIVVDTVLGAQGNYQQIFYSWSPNPNGMNGLLQDSIGGLSGGQYSLDVIDDLGCSGTATYNLSPLQSATSNDPNCYGESNGSIVAPGFTGLMQPVFFTWAHDASLTSNVVNSLPSGVYTFTVSDGMGCSYTDSIELIDPPMIAIDMSVTDVACATDSTGSAIVDTVYNAQQGVNFYAWDLPGLPTPPLNSNTATGLPSGQYSLIVGDDVGCTNIFDFYVGSPLDDSLVLSSCNNTLILHPNGSAAPFTVTITDSLGMNINLSGPNISNLISIPAGFYEVTVVDSAGCSSTDSVSLVNTPTISLMDSIQNVNCFGDSTGSISILSTINTTGPVDYFWSFNGVINPNLDTNTITNLASGNYGLGIVDSIGCVNQFQFVITEPGPLAFATLGSNPVTTTADGSVFCTVQGGTAPYDYTWLNLADNSTSNDSLWQNLNAGQYSITVTDSNGCSISDSVMIGVLSNPEFNEMTQVKLYPTLVNENIIRVELNDFTGNNIINIYDNSGRLVLEKTLMADTEVITLNLLKGIYHYTVLNNHKIKGSGQFIVTE